jgi:hypothetical protein
MTVTATETEGVPLPTCEKCQRQTGLAGGLCAFCLAESRGGTKGKAAELDRVLTELRREAVGGGVGKKPDKGAGGPAAVKCKRGT